jgi:hypothetical protein
MARPKGAISATTRSIQLFCRSIVEDPEYRATVLQRARNGTLGPMEAVVWAYGYGKPKSILDLHITREEEELSELSAEELALRASEVMKQLQAVRDIEAAILVEYEVAAPSKQDQDVQT